jgi:6-pyruvoyltetrahydropterin/6-carboxytetrahydropterin synthase
VERFGVRVEKEAFNFASGHFLIFADGTREELHGHNYQVSVELEGELDASHLVLDFRKFKPIVKKLCDALDHRTLLPADNPLLKIQSQQECWDVTFGSERMRFPLKDLILLPLANISAELLARYLCNQIKEEIARRFPEARLTRIEVGVEEGPGQIAFYSQEL